jgi:regulatory protein
MLTEEDFKIYLKRAANFCVYQERTHREVRTRLAEWQVFGDDAELLISELISERFISEERYAKAFAGGKFRVKHWGRIKIKYELKGKGISEYNIKTGMKEISDEDYAEKVKYLIERKLKEVRHEEKGIRNLKIAKFLISKGYESDIVWDEIRAL